MSLRRKLIKIGDSIGITLPRELLKLSGIEPGTEVIIRINENKRFEIIPEGNISVLNHDEINYQNIVQHLTKKLNRAKLEAIHAREPGYNQGYSQGFSKGLCHHIGYELAYDKGSIDGFMKAIAKLGDLIDRTSYNDKQKLSSLLLDILTKLSTDKGAS